MPRAKVKIKTSSFVSLLILCVIFFGLIAGLILIQKVQIFAPSAKNAGAQYCKSSGNSAVVCNGHKVGENIQDVCTCRYSSLGGNDCKCDKNATTNDNDDANKSGTTTARKILTDNKECNGCGGSKDCPIVDTKTYASFKLCKSAIGATSTRGPDSKNRLWAWGGCNPTGNKSYYWICYCKCASTSDCSNCRD